MLSGTQANNQTKSKGKMAKGEERICHFASHFQKHVSNSEFLIAGQAQKKWKKQNRMDVDGAGNAKAMDTKDAEKTIPAVRAPQM